MRFNIIKTVAAIAACFATTGASAQKYSEIYDRLPDMSLDQAYSELMSFQKKNPYFANTYIQIGIICEHKMVHTDPLRDINSAQFWSNNAHLFFGNFGIFYKDGDFRSNEEYYENLNIKASGKKVTEEDVKAFVAYHEKLCKDFRDTTMMIYTAIENAKTSYNDCISIFLQLCNKYTSYNDMLLRHDKSTDEALNKLSAEISNCEKQFAEYKRLTKAFPILGYRQIYEKKPIETFRLDGITNSDFYSNRFTIWDFQAWIDGYREIYNKSIVPLRKEIVDINAKFAEAKSSFEKGNAPKGIEEKPFDELFIFRLGKYDQNSLVRELFQYLERRRRVIEMACSELAQPKDSSISLMNRKMRHIYRTDRAINNAKKALDGMQEFITEERIVRFNDFFKKNYGGKAGLEKMKDGENTFLNNTFDKMLSDFRTYCKNREEKLKENTYSKKGDKAAAVPIWSVDDYEVGKVAGNYITKLVERDAFGRPTYVAGYKKSDLKTIFVAKIDQANKTEWISEVKSASGLKGITAASDRCIVEVENSGKPTAIVIGNSGKEMMRHESISGDYACSDFNDIEKTTYTLCNAETNVSYCATDSAGNEIKKLTLSDITKATHVESTGNGALVFGQNGGNIVIINIPNNGNAEKTMTINGDGLVIDAIFRASAQELCVITTGKNGKTAITKINNQGKAADN
ncbi:MAG: hypothetical protein MJZ01_01225 [Bacteroidales bacterium]|nr:hypothetical protein [Bacteroidales bacterium]